SVTFDAAIRTAMERNPSAELAAMDIARAEALVTQARSAWLPTLTAGVFYQLIDHERLQGGQVSIPQNQLRPNLLVAVPAVSPTQWVATARSKDAVAVAKRTSEDVRRQLAVATARAYLTVDAQHRVLETAERALTTARAHEE